MRHYHLKRNTTYCPTVNLDKLWTLVSEQTRVTYAKKPDGPAPIIDAVRAVSISCISNIELITPHSQDIKVLSVMYLWPRQLLLFISLVLNWVLRVHFKVNVANFAVGVEFVLQYGAIFHLDFEYKPDVIGEIFRKCHVLIRFRAPDFSACYHTCSLGNSLWTFSIFFFM